MPEQPFDDAARSSRARSWIADPMVRAVVSLGITQIIGWGTTVYVLGVLAKPIVADTGWRLDVVVAGVTLALLTSGVVSTPVGHWLDRIGARRIMVLGSTMTAVLQAAVAASSSAVWYLAAWALLGIAMRMCLYDAAFAALVQVTPVRGRSAISYLTLFGSFASSLFWPFGDALASALGWRSTFLVFAAMNLLICAPLHAWGLARRDRDPIAAATTATVTPTSPYLDGRARVVAMVLFAIVTSAAAFVFGALAVLLPAVLEAGGISKSQAIFLASLKGFAQFAGRICDIRYGQRLGILNVGRLSVAALPLSLACLIFGGGGFVMMLLFTVLFGVSNGLVTIVRGAVPLVLFGPVGYGAILGALATPYLVTNASASVLLAALIDKAGYLASEWVLLVASLIAVAAMELMTVWYRRLQTRSRT